MRTRLLSVLILLQVLVPAATQGRLETLTVGTRAVGVYTPPGYDKGRAKPYGVLVCFDGLSWYKDDIPVPAILDELIGEGKLPPLVAILVDTTEGRIQDLGNSRRFATFMASELIPWARARWNITKDPRETIVAGASAGGLAAANVAFHFPRLFGNVLSQSGAFWRGNEGSNSAPWEWLTGQYANSAKKGDLRFYVEVGGKETHKVVGVGPVFIEANRRFRDVLKAKGYAVTYVEVPGGEHEPGHWKPQFRLGLLNLIGPPK